MLSYLATRLNSATVLLTDKPFKMKYSFAPPLFAERSAKLILITLRVEQRCIFFEKKRPFFEQLPHIYSEAYPRAFTYHGDQVFRL